jgi:hypothetical protein
MDMARRGRKWSFMVIKDMLVWVRSKVHIGGECSLLIDMHSIQE